MAEARGRVAAGSLALFAVALAVRAAHLAALRESLLAEVLLSDAAHYDRWAQRIAAGDWIGSEVFYQTPLYPYLLGTLYALFGHEPWLARALQAGFGATACVLLARAGARWFSERAGWLAGILVALYPPAVFFDGLLQKASLDLLLMSALLAVAATAQREATRMRVFSAGLALGALILNRENAAALVPALLGWALWLGWRRRRAHALGAGALLALGVATVLVPVGVRNARVGGAFLLTTSQMGSNFYIGNHRGADGGYTPMRSGRGDPAYEREDARRIAEEALGRTLGPAEVSRFWMERSFEEIRDAPGAWLRLLAWKWFLTWNRVEMVDAEAISTYQSESPVLAVLGRALHFGVLVPLAVAGAAWTRRRWRELWLLYAMALTFAASVTLFYVFARYRYPLVSLAAMFAGAGLDGLVRRLRAPRATSLREAALALGLAGLAAIGANWPVPQRYRDDAITWYNVGTSLLDQGRTRDALAALERARHADPGFPETYNNLGRAWLALGDLAAATRALERGVALAPDHAVLHLNLAVAASRAGDTKRTRTLLARAIELDPLLVPAYGPLAELELRRGDVERAAALLRRAVELEPESAVAHADLATAWLVQGRVREAVAELREALRRDPTLAPVRLRLAWILATTPDPALRAPEEALAVARSLERDDGAESPAVLETLAAAHAAAGNFEAALERAKRGAARARAGGDPATAARLDAQIADYAAGRALLAPLTAPAQR